MSLKEKTKSSTKLKQPPLFKVILLNDDYTSMDFVVDVLITIFHKEVEEAIDIMFSVHEKGRGVCGIYTKEIAETKVMQVSDLANEYEFPLRAIMEEN